MKIDNRGGFHPVGQPEPSREPTAAQRTAEFGTAADAKKSAPLKAPAGATRADLDDPARMEGLLRNAVSQTLDASPLTAQLSPAQRQKLEAHLTADPSMRGLLTRFLEGTLR